MNTKSQLPDHIEEIAESPVNPETILTDKQLADGGLVKVNAFMRSKAGANALRVQKHRKKKEAEGIKQINIQGNEEMRQTIKVIAERTKAGEPLNKVLATLAGNAPAILPTERLTIEEKQLMQIGQQVKMLTGWRKTLARVIGVTA